MIEELKPYESYQESQVAWAPRLPAYWTVRRAKTLFERVKRQVEEGAEVVTCFRDGTVTLRRKRRLTGYTEAIFELGYQGIRRGDLVIHAMDAFAGAVGVSDSDGKASPVYAACVPRDQSVPAYYALVIRQMAHSQWILALAKGIRERSTDFRFEVFGTQFVPVPPPEEQAAIVRFLDHANRRIDQFIRSKKKLIALLNEQKQAIIHRAVTRGLDPNIKLKDSGVPWLGEVPAHWEVTKLKHVISTIEQGWSPQCDAQPVDTFDEWAVLKVGCVNKDAFLPHQNKKLPLALRPRPNLAIHKGDILMSRANTPALVGLAALVEQSYPRLMISDKHYRFRGSVDRVDGQFLVFALRAAPTRAQIESATNGASSSMQNISQQLVENLLVALPGVEEQRVIRAEVEASTAELRRAIVSTERELSFVSEYRTRLISDVVTGQLDVRAAAAKLPDLVSDGAPAEATDDEDADIDDTEAA